jgi:hypothetical protein
MSDPSDPGLVDPPGSDYAPDSSGVPYAITEYANGRFAFFGNGAIRRIDGHEWAVLTGEFKIRTFKHPANSTNAEKVSKELFGV